MARQRFKFPEVAGAMVRAGSAPTQANGSGRGNGDCALLDLATSFFAVSDSSDRNPAASRDLLLRFQDLFFANPGENLRPSQLTGYREEISKQAATVLSGVPSTVSCTLSALKFVQTREGWKGLLLHMGDSAVTAFNHRSGKVSPLTRSNFWLAGRTNRLYQVEWVVPRLDTWLVMTTDGVSDLAINTCLGRSSGQTTGFGEENVEQIAEALLETNHINNGSNDDAAVIALAPDNLKRAEACIVLGGTTAGQEKSFRQRCASGEYADQDLHLNGHRPSGQFQAVVRPPSGPSGAS